MNSHARGAKLGIVPVGRENRGLSETTVAPPLQDSSIHIRFRAVFATLQNEECDLVWFGDDQG